MKKFIKLEEYGQLYVDKILFESYFPIVFTCINDNKDIFIVVCCQNNEKGCKWLLGKTNGMSIVKMLRDEITIRQLLVDYSAGRISVDYVENNYSIAFNNSDWNKDSLYLPKEDSYMDAEEGEFEEEIHYFTLLSNSLHYNAEYYKYTSEILSGTIDKEIGTSMDTMTVSASMIENVPKEIIISVSKVLGELRIDLEKNTEKYEASPKYEIAYCDTFSIVSEDFNIKMESEDNIYTDAA